MRKLVSLATLASLLWMPLLVHAESFAVDRQIPMTETSPSPDSLAAADALFSYGDQAINILSLAIKRMRKDVEKWTIKGSVYPGITPS